MNKLLDKKYWCYLILAILEFVGFVIAILNHGVLVMGFYTQISNLVVLVGATSYVVYCLKHKDGVIPRWIKVLNYVSACMVTVTFITVVFVFIPMLVPSGIIPVLKVLFYEASLYHHFLGPIFAVYIFLALEDELVPGLKEALIAAIPTLMYAIVSTTLNVLKVVVGPYPFLLVYNQPVWVSVIWFFAIPGMGFVFAYLLGGVKRKASKRKEI